MIPGLFTLPCLHSAFYGAPAAPRRIDRWMEWIWMGLFMRLLAWLRVCISRAVGLIRTKKQRAIRYIKAMNGWMVR